MIYTSNELGELIQKKQIGIGTIFPFCIHKGFPRVLGCDIDKLTEKSLQKSR